MIKPHGILMWIKYVKLLQWSVLFLSNNSSLKYEVKSDFLFALKSKLNFYKPKSTYQSSFKPWTL